MPVTKKPNQTKSTPKAATKLTKLTKLTKPAKSTKAAKAKAAKAAKADTQVDRTSNLDQLSHKLRDLRQDLIRHLNQVRAGATTNVRRPQHLRRQIARHLTVMNEKRRGRASDSTKPADPPAATPAATATPVADSKAAVKPTKQPKGKG